MHSTVKNCLICEFFQLTLGSVALITARDIEADASTQDWAKVVNIKNNYIKIVN